MTRCLIDAVDVKDRLVHERNSVTYRDMSTQRLDPRRILKSAKEEPLG